MKKIITNGLVGVLLIGIISASLLSYFGIITGSVEVENPVFYLDGSLGGVYYNLFINEISEDEEEVYLYDGNRLLFITEPLEINEFYQAKFDIHVWAKTNEVGNLLQFQVVKIKPNLDEEIICVPSAISIISEYDQFKERTASCSSQDTISLNLEDRIGLEIKGAGIDSEYWISTGKKYSDGASRIEVTSAT